MRARRVSSRAVLQVFLTLLTITSGVSAFVFSIIFRRHIDDELHANNGEELKTNALPCFRSTLNVCNNAIEDKCWSKCCPPGYTCDIDPTVGLYCKNEIPDCVENAECLKLADITGECRTPICQKKTMIINMTKISVLFCVLAVILDVVDLFTFCIAPDSVSCKASINLLCSGAKWLAYGVVVGTGTQKFLLDLHTNKCYSADGQEIVEQTILYFMIFCVSIATSAVCSLAEAPFSAYYGGKLVGVPYVK